MSANSTELRQRNATAPSIDGNGERVAAAAQGESAAFTELYETYGRNVYNLVLRSTRDPATAEDLCQEIWVKAYRRLRELREHGAFATWLYRIASRACVDHARRRPLATVSELPDLASDEPGPEARAIRHEQEGLAWEALAALPARQHVALFLREVEERSYAEIATIMETTESAVETLLFRARRGLAAAYERLQLAMPERCGQAREAMSTLLDGEGTAVQQRAVGAHVDACESCRGQLSRMQRASVAYAAVPILPVPAFLAQRVIEAAGVSALSTGGGLLAKLVGLWGTNAKMAVLSATLATGVATGALVVTRDDFLPFVTSAEERGAPAVAPEDASDAIAAGVADDGPGTVPSSQSVLPPGPADVIDSVADGLPVPALPLAPAGPLSELPAVPGDLPALDSAIVPPPPELPLAQPELPVPLSELPAAPLDSSESPDELFDQPPSAPVTPAPQPLPPPPDPPSLP